VEGEGFGFWFVFVARGRLVVVVDELLFCAIVFAEVKTAKHTTSAILINMT
jgi:hypothetical protein